MCQSPEVAPTTTGLSSNGHQQKEPHGSGWNLNTQSSWGHRDLTTPQAARRRSLGHLGEEGARLPAWGPGRPLPGNRESLGVTGSQEQCRGWYREDTEEEDLLTTCTAGGDPSSPTGSRNRGTGRRQPRVPSACCELGFIRYVTLLTTLGVQTLTVPLRRLADRSLVGHSGERGGT